MTEIASIFASVQHQLDADNEVREGIRKITKELEQESRRMLASLQQIHGKTAHGALQTIVQAARADFGKVQEWYQQLRGAYPAGQFYRFNDMWRYTTQQFIFLSSLIVYLEAERLLEFEEVHKFLGVRISSDDANADEFAIPLEDFLMGVCSLPGELARFCVNSVVAGDYSRPQRILNFVTELNAGFRLLNLKNDNLRKRYDSLKYDVKKIEEVVYDLSIRGLKNE